MGKYHRLLGGSGCGWSFVSGRSPNIIWSLSFILQIMTVTALGRWKCSFPPSEQHNTGWGAGADGRLLWANAPERRPSKVQHATAVFARNCSAFNSATHSGWMQDATHLATHQSYSEKEMNNFHQLYTAHWLCLLLYQSVWQAANHQFFQFYKIKLSETSSYPPHSSYIWICTPFDPSFTS